MVENQEHYPRDLRGYAGQPPHARWPGGARIAVQFVLNYEEGAENHVLHGDAGWNSSCPILSAPPATRRAYVDGLAL